MACHCQADCAKPGHLQQCVPLVKLERDSTRQNDNSSFQLMPTSATVSARMKRVFQAARLPALARRAASRSALKPPCAGAWDRRLALTLVGVLRDQQGRLPWDAYRQPCGFHCPHA